MPATVTVPKLPTDTTGPKITGIAVEDEADGEAGSVYLTVSSEAGSPLATGTGTQILIDVADPAADFKREAYVIRSNAANPLLSANIDVALVAETNSQTQELTLASSGEWKAGDQIVINRGALRDDDNNPSPQARITVSAARKSPTVSAVNVSNENHVDQAADGVPGALTADSGGTAQEDRITITAKKDGPAGGVHGNGWTVTVRTASSWKSAGDADISVGVDEAGRRVVVTIRNGTPTWGQLKAALDGNSAFAKRFDVELAKTTPDTAGVCPKPNSAAKLTIPAAGIAVDGGTATLAGGVTTVAVEVQFNGYIKALTGDVLRDAVFAGAVKRHASAITDLQITTISAVATGAPFKTVRYEITANESDAAALPKPGSGNDQVQADSGGAL